MLLDEAEAPVDVRMRGVTLAFLLRLVETGTLSGSWTIQESVDRFVRPSIARFKCCLFDLVPRQYSGQPQYFVSHTWSRTLDQLLGLLKLHFKVASSMEAGSAHIVLWLDIVAINQHPYTDKGCLQNDDVASLAQVSSQTINLHPKPGTKQHDRLQINHIQLPSTTHTDCSAWTLSAGRGNHNAH